MPSAQDEALEIQQAMSLLSPQERAAMEDDGDDAVSVLDQLQDNGDTERRPITELPESKDKDDAPEPEEEVVQEDAPAVAAKPAEPVVEAPAPAPIVDFNYNVPAVADFDAKMAALSTERAKAMKDLMAGEITDDEYAAVDTRTMSERDAIAAQQNRHLIAQEMNEQRAIASWQRSIADIKTQAKADGVDYDADPKMNGAWDKWVKTLAADPDNDKQSGEWFLKEAHRLVKLQYDLPSVEQKASKTPDMQPAKPAAQRNRIPDLSKIPPTLGKAPAAATESEGESGEFAHIEKLEGIARERALARLTPDQEARYLES